MQLQVGKAVPGAEHYDGMVDCFRKIIAKEGCVARMAPADHDALTLVLGSLAALVASTEASCRL